MAKEGDYSNKATKNKVHPRFLRRNEEEKDYNIKSVEDNNIKDYKQSQKKEGEFAKRREDIQKAKENLYKPFTIQKGLRVGKTEYKNQAEDIERRYNQGLVAFNEKIKDGNMQALYREFFAIKNSLDEEEILPEEKAEKYRKALASRGYRLVNRLHRENKYSSENEDILKYYIKHHVKKSSGLEKAITVISLLMVITGLAFWYPAVTGNVIAQNSAGFVSDGLILFLLGLLGVFIANKN